LKHIVAIDGFSGTGKTTVGKELALRLGFNHISSGNLYRGITYLFVKSNINFEDLRGVKSLLDNYTFEFVNLDGIKINDLHLIEELREELVETNMGNIARLPEVREKVNSLLKEIALEWNVVIDGRDIGTFVFPDAHVKFFFTKNSSQENLVKELENYNLKNVDLNGLEEIDIRDINRPIAPLRKAPDAEIIYSYHSKLYELFDLVEQMSLLRLNKFGYNPIKSFRGQSEYNIVHHGKLVCNLLNEPCVLIQKKPTNKNIQIISKAKAVIFTEKLFMLSHEVLMFMDYCIPFIHGIDGKINEYINKNITIFFNNGLGIIYLGEKKILMPKNNEKITYAFSSTKSGMDYYHKTGASILATRGEFIYLQCSKLYPLEMLSNESERKRLYISMKKLITYALRRFSEVIYRFTDFSDEYSIFFIRNDKNRVLSNINPVIGNRGAYRLLNSDLDFLDFQITWISEIFGANKNISTVLPFVRSIDEAKKAVEMIRPKFSGRLGCMIEIPSILQHVKELNYMFDFFIIGCSDFLQLLQGSDRRKFEFQNVTHTMLSELLRTYFLPFIDVEKKVFITSKTVYNQLNNDFKNLFLLNK